MSAEYNRYVYQKFDNPDAVKKWSDEGLYSVSLDSDASIYNDKLYRMKYVLDGVPNAGGKGERALDLGCAGGAFIPYLTQKGYEVTGVDISSQMIDQARRYCGKMNIPADLSIMDVNHTEFQSGYFDVCIAAGLIEHQKRDELLLREVKRVLKKGGTFVVTVRNYMCPHLRWQDVCSNLERSISNFLRRLKGRPASAAKKSHGREHILPKFLKVLEAEGFACTGYRFSHFYTLPYPISKKFRRLDNIISKKIKW